MVFTLPDGGGEGFPSSLATEVETGALIGVVKTVLRGSVSTQCWGETDFLSSYLTPSLRASAAAESTAEEDEPAGAPTCPLDTCPEHSDDVTGDEDDKMDNHDGDDKDDGGDVDGDDDDDGCSGDGGGDVRGERVALGGSWVSGVSVSRAERTTSSKAPFTVEGSKRTTLKFWVGCTNIGDAATSCRVLFCVGGGGRRDK